MHATSSGHPETAGTAAPDTSDAPGIGALGVGTAEEGWTGDAEFHEYSRAADPIGNGLTSPIPVRSFPASLHEDGPTRIVPLDLSDELRVPYTATSPGLLASFVVLRPGEMVATAPDATSELYFCLRGSGRSAFTSDRGADDQSTGTIPWGPGDVVALPAGCTTVHTADDTEKKEGERPAGDGAASDGAVLYRVTDAPLLRYLGARPHEPRFRPTRHTAEQIRTHLDAAQAEPDAANRSRIAVLLANAVQRSSRTLTHTLWAMYGVLPAGTEQRPHRHQSVALDLVVACAPGCYSLVGDALDADGQIVDPVRVDWEPGGAFVTPPGRWHSHHNTSSRAAYFLPVQDAGLHTYLRSLDIRFGPR